MKRVGKVLIVIVEVILVLYVIVLTTFLLCRNKFGYTEIAGNTLVSINKDNLNTFSDFKMGDLVVLNYIGYNATNVGDVIYYYDVSNNEYVIKKGTVSEKTGDYQSALYNIKEDANAAVAEERVLGLYSNKYEKLGAVIAFLETTVGFLIFVLLPILVIFIYQLYNLIMLIKNKDVDDEEPKKGAEEVANVSVQPVVPNTVETPVTPAVEIPAVEKTPESTVQSTVEAPVVDTPVAEVSTEPAVLNVANTQATEIPTVEKTPEPIVQSAVETPVIETSVDEESSKSSNPDDEIETL